MHQQFSREGKRERNMNTKSSLIFLLPLTLFLSFYPQLTTSVVELNLINNPISNGNNNLISQACGVSTRKDFCISLLNSLPDSQNTDLKGLAFIALRAAMKNATEISTQIKTLLNDTNVTPGEDEGLDNCAQAYLDAIDQIQDSIAALISNAPGDIETWVKAAIADIDTCESGVKGQTTLVVELSRKNRVLRVMCNIALGIVHVLARN